MCNSDVGVVKRVELESISKDIADLVKQLDREVEGKINVSDVRKVEEKLRKVVEQ